MTAALKALEPLNKDVKSLGRICVFSPFPMFPDTAGNRIRLKILCQDLKDAGFEIHFVYHPREDGGSYKPEDLARHKQICEQVFIVPYLGSYPKPRGKTHVESDIWDPSIEPFAQSLFKNIRYDAVIVNYTPFARFLTYAPLGCKKIIDTHDKLSGRLSMLEQDGLEPNFYYMDDAEEGRLLALADLIISIKEEEAAHYHKVSGGVPVLTVGMNPVSGWNGREAIQKSLNPEKIVAGFIGSVNVVNSKAIRAMVQALLELKDSCESLDRVFSLNVYGSICNELRELELPACVKLKGFIDDALDFYDEVDVVLIPTVRSTGLKIKAIEALNSQRIILATADGFSGVQSPFEFHTQENVFNLVKHFLQILNQSTEIRLASLEQLNNATSLVFNDYRNYYNESLKKLIRSISKVNARLKIDWLSETKGWIKTLVVLRAALPALSLQYELFLIRPEITSVAKARVKQLEDLSIALPSSGINFLSETELSLADISLKIEVDPSGVLNIFKVDAAEHRLGDYVASQTLLTGFAIQVAGSIRSWIPRCGFVHNYWGKNCILLVLLDGISQEFGGPLIEQATSYLSRQGIKCKVEFIVSEAAVPFYSAAGQQVIGMCDFLAKPRFNTFLGVVDLAEGLALNDRSFTIYSLSRCFYVVDSHWKLEQIQSLRGEGAAVTLAYGVESAFATAIEYVLCEDSFQKLNTHHDSPFSSVSLLKTPREFIYAD